MMALFLAGWLCIGFGYIIYKANPRSSHNNDVALFLVGVSMILSSSLTGVFWWVMS